MSNFLPISVIRHAVSPRYPSVAMPSIPASPTTPIRPSQPMPSVRLAMIWLIRVFLRDGVLLCGVALGRLAATLAYQTAVIEQVAKTSSHDTDFAAPRAARYRY